MSALPARTSDPGRGLAMLATALGPDIAELLAATDTIEVIVNPDGRVWVERLGSGRTAAGFSLDASETERAIRLIATLTGTAATRDKPIVSAELPPRGERFEGVLPPVVRAPCFSIRKPAGRVIRLEDYVADGVVTPEQSEALKTAVAQRANIIVAGGTGSGKTTLANALLAEIARLEERVVILEDTRELQCAAEDVVALRTQPGAVTLSDLVRSTLRLRPDRIIVGEVRGPEALDLLKAWNTGHPGGIATLHANSARAALSRLEQLAMEASTSPPTALIAAAIDLVVFIERGGPAGRRISEIYAPKALDTLARGPRASSPQEGAKT
jgi:P-type conjugative transfer ATPase TrbB